MNKVKEKNITNAINFIIFIANKIKRNQIRQNNKKDEENEE